MKFLVKEVNETDATVIIDELGLCRGQVRIDIAVVNGLLHGMKSSRIGTVCAGLQVRLKCTERCLIGRL